MPTLYWPTDKRIADWAFGIGHVSNLMNNDKVNEEHDSN